MAAVTIGACQGCGACLLTCPEHAIRPAGGTLHVLPGRCTGCLECVEICPVGVISISENSASETREPQPSESSPVSRVIHPIEEESYAILRARADTAALAPLTRAVTERVVHASADFDYLTDLVCVEEALAAGAVALRRGAPVVADSAMVAAGITSREVVCRVRDPRARSLATRAGITRSAAGMHVACRDAGPGAVWVIGTAPTALFELLTLDAAPALVIGLPVGFVGAAEAKAALRASGWPALTNQSDKGGAAVAAAALNALLYLEEAR